MPARALRLSTTHGLSCMFHRAGQIPRGQSPRSGPRPVDSPTLDWPTTELSVRRMLSLLESHAGCKEAWGKGSGSGAPIPERTWSKAADVRFDDQKEVLVSSGDSLPCLAPCRCRCHKALYSCRQSKQLRTSKSCFSMSPSPPCHGMGGVETYPERRASPQCHKQPRQSNRIAPSDSKLAAVGRGADVEEGPRGEAKAIQGAKRGNQC
ncbi:hypothetical protein J3F84DRAFT_387362 [Trichoderma pleuroticola]